MDDQILERSEGRARTGFVSLFAFDEGVIETIGATIDEASQNYFLQLKPVETVGFDPGICSPFNRGTVDPRPGLPGIPVTFSSPEDVFEKYSIPVILIRREGLDPALQRWHPGTLQYRAPGRGALPVEYRDAPTSVVKQGFDRVEQVEQAVPYDLMYSINVMARSSSGSGGRQQATRLLDHIIRVYPPYCEVRVRDSIDDVRTYEAFQEGISPLDQVAGINDRVIGFSVSLRIEGELDTIDPVIRRTVTRRAQAISPR